MMKNTDAAKEMVGFDEGRRLVLNALSPLPAEYIQLTDAAGRTLAQETTAKVDVPLNDISLRDGYAVISRDTEGASAEKPVRLEIAGESLAGIPGPEKITRGQAAAINTGAVLPSGADSIIPFEYAERVDDKYVLIKEVAEKGAFIVRKGEEFRLGENILGPGSVLDMRSIACLIATGYVEVHVHRLPRIRVFAVGDELRAPGRDLRTGQGYPGISYGITSIMDMIGTGGIRIELVPDESKAIIESLPEPEAVDLVVTVGGTGRSNSDLVIKDLRDAGVAFLFHGIRMRPCHSMAFGIMETKIPVLCLPGSISAAELGFYQFVMPAMMKLLGRRDFSYPEIKAVLEREVLSRKGEMHFIRTRLEGMESGGISGKEIIARPLRRKKIYKEMLESHGYIVIPEDREVIKAKEEVTVQLTAPEMSCMFV